MPHPYLGLGPIWVRVPFAPRWEQCGEESLGLPYLGPVW